MEHDQGDASIERKKDELIRATEDPGFQKKVLQLAGHLTRNKMDAEDYSQEAITRFIAAVQHKACLGDLAELERLRPLPYIHQIMKNLSIDEWKKTHQPGALRKTSHQANRSQEETSEDLGCQKRILLAAQQGVSVEDIIDQRAEAGRSTNLGGDEYVASEIDVKAMINSLPKELQEPTRRLVFGEYQPKELAEEMGLTRKEVECLKKQVREALDRHSKEQTQLEKKRGESTHGR